eukprot:15395789-Alexandrium_andersonii.AAC.1
MRHRRSLAPCSPTACLAAQSTGRSAAAASLQPAAWPLWERPEPASWRMRLWGGRRPGCCPLPFFFPAPRWRANARTDCRSH